MAHSIVFKGSVEKQFERLPDQIKRRLAAKIDALSEDPTPRSSERLVGSQGLFRIRVGSYRVVYTVIETEMTVVILKIGHRREVYRGRLR